MATVAEGEEEEEEEGDEEAVMMGEEDGAVFLRGKLEEGVLKKDRHRIGRERGKAFLADLKCVEMEMEFGSILAQNDAMGAEVERGGSGE